MQVEFQLTGTAFGIPFYFVSDGHTNSIYL